MSSASAEEKEKKPIPIQPMKRRPPQPKQIEPKYITFSVIIRSHGYIPVIHWEGARIEEMIELVDYKKLNIENLIDITTSFDGRTCSGNPDLQPLIKAAEAISEKDTSTIIDELIFSENEILTKTLYKSENTIPFVNEHLQNVTINKHYIPYDDKSGIFLFSYDNDNGISELNNKMIKNKINEEFQKMNDKLTKEKDKRKQFITKKEILETISNITIHFGNQIKIKNLFFIDFTCNAYIFLEKKGKLLEKDANVEYAQWVSNEIHLRYMRRRPHEDKDKDKKVGGSKRNKKKQKRRRKTRKNKL